MKTTDKIKKRADELLAQMTLKEKLQIIIETIAQYYRTTPEKIKELNPEMKKLKKGLKIRVR